MPPNVEGYAVDTNVPLRSRVRAALVLLSVSLVWYCGDAPTDPDPGPPPLPPVPITVTVVPESVGFTALGDTATLAATVGDQNGAALPGAAISWASSDPGIASVEMGRVTAVSDGEVSITAKSGTVSGSAAVHVEQVAVRLDAVPPALKLSVIGDTVRLSATAYDANDHEVASAVVDWSSSDTVVATVSDGGLVTAVSGGTAEIVAVSGAASDSVAVSVAQEAFSLEVEPPSLTFAAPGDTARLVAVVRDARGNVVSSAVVDWSSSDTVVATVSDGGLVTAVSGGTAEIVAVSGAASDSVAVSVAQEAFSLEVEPPSLTFAAPGDTARLVAVVRDARGNVVSSAVVEWSSSDTGVATVSDGGLVTAVSGGTAEIAAVSRGARATVAVRVEDGNERDALIAFYRAAGGPSWRRSDNWLTDAPLGEWYGVTTGPNGRVTALRLRENGGSGTLAPDLGRLSHLETLDLYGNPLTGPMPPELAAATRLREIEFGRNQYNGSIPPEFGKLSKLRYLNLEYMWLSGSIPRELGALKELRFFNVYSNLLSGRLPPELGDLHQLETLHVADNRFGGAVPSTFTNLGNLRRFTFHRNVGLCAPATEDFLAWRGQRYTQGPSCDMADRAALGQLFEGLGGAGWTRRAGWLGDGALSGWYGIDTDSLGRVKVLDLSDNGLAGELPPQLSDLSAMTVLRLDGNPSLYGPVPQSLTALMLEEFRYGGTELCVYDTRSFRDWLSTIRVRDGPDDPCPALSEREILVLLYEATGGAAWTDNTNWLTNAPLREWYGVATNSDGAVTELVLWGNNLRGRIPPEVGQLEALTILDLDWNWMRGQIPAALADLEQLRTLSLHSNLLEGSIPPQLGELRRLEQLFLSDNRLLGRIPATLGALTSLREMSLRLNGLDGPIPPELANLTSLEDLRLSANQLEGPIPPELGRLRNLVVLWLFENQLTGSIPPELGDMSSIRVMYLGFNKLSGTIPPELGNLPSVWGLALDANELTGPIPPELGSLTSLADELNLVGNRLTGPIPPELGALRALAKLRLGQNDLEGAIPPELGQMTNLEWLDLSHNPKLQGPVPPTFTNLGRLASFEWRGTGLCLPDEGGLLQRASVWRLPRCDGAALSGSQAYLTQTVQSLEYPVPLLEGESALLRVFALAGRPTGVGIPDVRATFHYQGAEIHAVDVPGKSTPLPVDLAEAEASLEKSANARVPGWVVRPGVEMAIEIDPDGTLDPALGVPSRIPASGYLPLLVERVPTFELMVVPFLWSTRPDSTAVDLAAEMEADPDGHRLLWETADLLPVVDLSVEAHEPVLTSSNNSDALLDEVGAIRVMEGGRGYYMAALSGEATGAWGVAWIPGTTSYARIGVVTQPEEALTIAHELGHNLGLYHAPCGVSSVLDRAYPHPGAAIGAWGLDTRSGRDVLVPATTADFMSYCVPAWIGDYNFSKVVAHRTGGAAGDAPPPPTTTMLLWGGARADGTPYLNPAFTVTAPPALPRSDGEGEDEYEIAGRAADGSTLFSLSFDMAPVADSDGRLAFAYAVPVEGESAALLEEITLSGPGGSATMDRNTDRPAVVLRDRASGRVRGLLRDLPQSVRTLADAVAGLDVGPDVKILFSRGLPHRDPDR